MFYDLYKDVGKLDKFIEIQTKYNNTLNVNTVIRNNGIIIYGYTNNIYNNMIVENAIILIQDIDKLLLNDDRIIQELMSFISRSNTYKAEEGQHDDLVMTLVFFSWLSRQEYYNDLIESAKFSYAKPENVNEDNVLFMQNSEQTDDNEEFSDGEVIWYPT